MTTDDVGFALLPNGREVAYRQLATTEGPTLVFLPGGTVPIEVVEEERYGARFLRCLGRYGRLVAIDRPGIGASDAFDPERDLGDQLAEAVVAVLDAMAVEDAWIVGSNLPAAVTLHRLLQRAPSRVAGGALLNPGRGGTIRDRSGVDRLVARDGEVSHDVLAHISPGRADDPSYRAWHERAGRLGASATAAKAFYAGLARSIDAIGSLPATPEPTPVLMLHRRESRVVHPEDVEWWRQRFPGSELITIDGADLSFESNDADVVADTIGTHITGSRQAGDEDRPLLALLFVDIVGSTSQASEAGDGSWRGLLERYEASVASVVDRHGGTIVKHTGDGSLVTFATPSRALAAAVALRDHTRGLGLAVRMGMHVGEVEHRGDDIGGIAVHLAARVMDQATGDQLLVTEAVVQTTIGGRQHFEEIGDVELKGIDRPWTLYDASLGRPS